MMPDTEKAIERPAEKTEHTYFVCKHVLEKTRAIDGCWSAPDWKRGEHGNLLCGECDTGETPLDKLEGTILTEAEAISRKFLPKSRAMQYLLAITNDKTGGMAVASWCSRLRGALWQCGLFYAEIIFLFDIFGRGETDLNVMLDAERQGKECPEYTGPGFGELDDEEEAEAVRILRKRSAYLRAEAGAKT
jgi:hypothetical protein